MHKRLIWDQLTQEIQTPEVVVITGPRQVGKTTTLKWLLDQIEGSNKLYIDLENIIERELFESKDYQLIPNELKRRGLRTDQPIYLVLDEIQLVPNLPSVVKYLHDHFSVKFFLSGSSSYYIKNRFTESMAGRKVVYEMLPLSFQEFLIFKQVEYQLPNFLEDQAPFNSTMFERLKSYYQEYITYGGLPRVVLTHDHDRKKQLLSEIFSSYINIDVQTLADFKSTTDLRQVIKLLAARVGSKLNVSEIGKIVGLNRVTVDSYVQFLEQTYLITTVPAFSRSVDVQSRLQKKPYFIDTGIATINADLSGGSKFENTIQHQLSRYGELYYFGDRSSEIDFILKTDENDYAFEVKVTPLSSDLTTLKRLADTLGVTQSQVIGQQPSAEFDQFIWGGSIR